jgi:pimeloyl-ACP methyl ester carboxylesterase
MSLETEVVKVASIALEHYVPVRETRDKKLLFIHSSGHGSWMWKNFLNYFAGKGYDSWALNLRGHYLSGPVKDWAVVGVSEYLDDIHQAVKRAEGNVVLVGHSMSGLLVLKYAEARKLAGLIVSQSGPPQKVLQKRGIQIKMPEPPKGRRMVTDKAILPMKDREMVKAILFDKGNVDEESVNLVLDKIGEESLRAAKEIMNMEVDPGKITAPLYVLGFDGSKIGIQSPADANRVLADEFKARDYKVIEPGGHNYMLEKNWQVFAQQFEAWIETD